MDKAQYITLQQKIKAGTATPEEIQAVKDYEDSLDTRNWYEKGSTVAEDQIAELEQKKRMENPIEGASGDIARGNQGDNALANPNALDTSEVTDVHQKELASVQTPEDMNPGTFTTDNSIREEAEAAKSPESVKLAQPEKDDSAKDANAKKRYNKSMMSIWDAYNNGLIDKETACYFTVDAIATLAKNLGRGIGNVGAQFTGGSIDQGHDESMWDKRKNEIFSQELQGEAEGIENYTNTMKRYNLNKASTINELLSTVKADVDKLDNDNPAKIAYLALAAQMANGQIDGNTTLAGVGAKAAAPLLEKLEDWFGKGK